MGRGGSAASALTCLHVRMLRACPTSVGLTNLVGTGAGPNPENLIVSQSSHAIVTLTATIATAARGPCPTAQRPNGTTEQRGLLDDHA